MKRVVWTALFLLMATGCVTSGELDRRLGTWTGRDSDQLASLWGAPSGSYQKKDGSRILSYERMGVVTTGPGEFSQTYSRNCRIDFLADKDGKITSASWHGAADQCDRSIIPYTGGADLDQSVD